MKKFTQNLFIVFMSCVCGTAMSQEVGFGLKGGLNLATLNFDDPEASYDSRTGYHGGIFLRGKFDRIGIQPEILLYTYKGEIENSLFGTAQESFSYVTIPVMLKFYPVAGLNLQAGPQMSFLIDGERQYNNVLFGSGSEDIKDHYKASDLSISVGGGYDFGFGLTFDARYNVGVKDINNAANGEPVKSRAIMISLGWNFLR